jgi:hypothetical protein
MEMRKDRAKALNYGKGVGRGKGGDVGLKP